MAIDSLMDVLLRARVMIVVGVLAITAGTWWLQHDRVTFVTKCWNNGNGLGSCNCTFNALEELPPNYQKLAKSWAHDSSTAFAGSVMLLVAKEMERIIAPLIKGNREKAVSGWIATISKVLGWGALGAAAPKIGTAIAAGVVIVDATNEATSAQQVMRSHCGSGWSFMVRVDETRKAAVELAGTLSSQVIDTAADAGVGAVESTGNAASRAWNWTKSWFWSAEPEEKK
jgi:hypothetical protein